MFETKVGGYIYDLGVPTNMDKENGYDFTDVVSILEESPIYFKNSYVFDENYIPPKIRGRDAEIAEVTDSLKYVTRGEPHPNLTIFGRPGTGKSLVVRYVLKGLKHYLSTKHPDIPYDYSYVPCKDYSTEMRVLEKIIYDISGEETKLTGRSRTYGYNLIKSLVENGEKTITIVLDDADILSDPDKMLMSLSRLETTKGSISLIIISNNTEFEKRLKSRTSSSLKARNIVFDSYSAPQLEDILWDRVEEGVVDGLIKRGDGVVEYCAAVATQVGGDARYAIRLLRETISLAERERIRDITVEVAERAHRKLEESVVVESVRKLPFQSQLILVAAAIPTLHGLLPRGRDYLLSGELYFVYTKLCKLAGTSPLSYRRYYDLLQELDLLGLLNVRLRSLGRSRGRTQTITLMENPELIIEAFVNSNGSRLGRDDLEEFAKRLRSAEIF